MRLKKVKDAQLIIEKSKYFIKNPFDKRGNYKKMFDNNNPVHLEIGTGKGDFIIENAIKYPNINFIGMEKYDSVLVRAIQKAEQYDFANLLFINEDAAKITEIFNKEIDVLYLNFSDPWPKKRHSKRRLTSNYFLTKYDSIFYSNQQIVFKTDNRDLFEFSIICLVDYGYKIKFISLDLHSHKEINDNIMTEYEQKFVKKGFPIYKLEVKK